MWILCCCLFNQFLGFEVFPQIQNLPGGQSQQTAHGENGKIQNTGIRRLIGVTHLKNKIKKVNKK